MFKRPTIAIGAAVLSLALAAAGCGSSSSSSSSGSVSSSSASATASTSTPAAATKTCPPLTGSPIDIADITDQTGLPGTPFIDFPESETVAVDYVNHQLCGVDGHPLRLTKCDSKFNPAASAACANQVVAQRPRPVIDIGIDTNLWPGGAKTLHAAGLIDMNATSPDGEQSDLDSFPITGGACNENRALGYFLGSTIKAKNPVSVQEDIPVAGVFTGFVKAGLEQQGVTKLAQVLVPPTATEITSYAAKSAQGHDAIITDEAGSLLNNFYAAWKQDGLPADKTITGSDAMDASSLKGAGSAANGAYFSTPFADPDQSTNPQVAVYRAAMAKYGPSLNADASFMEWGFSNILTLYQAMKKIGGSHVTAQTISKYFHDTPTIPGYLGTKLTASSAPKSSPALRNIRVSVVQWENGKFIPVNGGKFFVPPTAAAGCS